MTKAGPAAPVVHSSAACETASVPATVDAPRGSFECASEEALFTSFAATVCDACGGPLPDDEADDPPYEVPGAGVYMWTRGDEVRLESAPLCPSCASAIGMTALARWEIEEEEG